MNHHQHQLPDIDKLPVFQSSCRSQCSIVLDAFTARTLHRSLMDCKPFSAPFDEMGRPPMVLHRLCVPLNIFACSLARDVITSVVWSGQRPLRVPRHCRATFQTVPITTGIWKCSPPYCPTECETQYCFILFCSRDIRDDDFIELFKRTSKYLIFVSNAADLP
jgi:hypothetical protein